MLSIPFTNCSNSLGYSNHLNSFQSYPRQFYSYILASPQNYTDDLCPNNENLEEI